MIDFKKLTAYFQPEIVSWRVGSTNKEKTGGYAFAYLDARDYMDRLDEVCGQEYWQNKYSHTEGKTVCDIGIDVSRGDGRWVWKADGAGDSDIEADKGALSDAFKRAGVRWGIGRYLYEMKSVWVDIEAKGNSYIIKPSELIRIRGLLPKPKNDLEDDAVTLAASIDAAKTAGELDDLVHENSSFTGSLKEKAPKWHKAMLAKIDAKRLSFAHGRAN